VGTARKRIRPAKASYLDGALALAVNGLFGAVGAMINPRPYPKTGGGYNWVDSRYDQLREGVSVASVSGRGHTVPSSLVPLQIDYLKLKIAVDARVRVLSPILGDTPARLHQLTRHRWRPQDRECLIDISAEIQSWVKAVDDLLAVPPIYLRGHACPQCNRTFAYKIQDDGQKVRTQAALTLSVDHGAQCLSCHATWDLGQLGLLSKLLGFAPPPGVIGENWIKTPHPPERAGAVAEL
jgi:hypothetical protein